MGHEVHAQARTPSLGATEWEWHIQKYADLAEEIAAQPQHADIGFLRINATEVVSAATQHAQGWVALLLEAVHAAQLASVSVRALQCNHESTRLLTC